MRIYFTGKTNKDYVMVNTLKIRLASGSVLTLDRETTVYTLGEPDENKERELDMDWRGCYLWELDDMQVYEEEPITTEEAEKLLKGASLEELELDYDADEDYYVVLTELCIEGIYVPCTEM